MRSGPAHPLNLGTDELVTINELVEMVAEISEKRITKRHDLSKPQGVRGRNSDNSRLREVLDWEPKIPPREGLTPTYRWIESELRTAGRVSPARLEQLVEGLGLPLRFPNPYFPTLSGPPATPRGPVR